MQIFIEGKQVYIEEDSSFEYVSENRFFTNSETYSMAITIPLRGVAQNKAIFGNINRIDSEISNKVYKCRLVDKNLTEEGVAVIVGTTQTEVKVQFLSNRSAQNYDKTFDDIYINELDLGYIDESIKVGKWSVNDAWGLNPQSSNYLRYVAIPWVNDYSGNIQNECMYSSAIQKWSWDSDTKELSFMPYLLEIAKRICKAVGFTYDFAKWEASNWRYLLCCNCLPASWGSTNFADYLPRWQVDEFFDEIEKIMQCEVSIDYVNKHISFDWSKDVSEDAGVIKLENIVDEYSSEIKNIVSEDEDYSYSQLYKYASSGDNECDYDLCDWLVQDNGQYIEEMTDEAFIAWLAANKDETKVGKFEFLSGDATGGDFDYSEDNPYRYIIHAMGNYWVLRFKDLDHTKDGQFGTSELKWREYYYSLQIEKIATFGPFLTEDEENGATEISIVPVHEQWADIGRLLHMDCGELSETITAEETEGYSNIRKSMSRYSKMIDAGEQDNENAVFDVIRVGFLNPNIGVVKEGYAINPIVDDIVISDYMEVSDISAAHGIESMRINTPRQYSSKINFSQVNPSDKYTFDFIANEIPNVRSVFIIHGKRYLCEKITITFTPRGMQKKLKGVFYPINE